MTAIFRIEEIRAALAHVDVIAAMERAFVNYSRGLAVLPPVGEMLFHDPPGDVHIKYGYVIGDDYYVVKVASGFYDNPGLGLASSNGLMLLFRQQTGELIAVLLDEGHLTDVRTAAAGAAVARCLAPKELDCIGIVGCGAQAEQQLRYLSQAVDCRRVLVWGRRPASLRAWMERCADTGFEIGIAAQIGDIVDRCRLIITNTPSAQPLLHEVRAGTHITAIGSDTPEKQELAPAILAAADIVAVDSRVQCQTRGEVFQALRAGVMGLDSVVELGDIIAGHCPGRQNDAQITVADLTGIATQDIEIARAVYEGIRHVH